jgi:SAM-dependent methyltransferase
MDRLLKDFVDTYYYGSFWAFKHYDKIIRRAFNCLYQKPKVAVEVGCGDGMATYFLSKYVDQLICIDTNENFIQKAKGMVEETGIKNVTFKKMDSDKLSLDNEVDLIIFKDVLHHMQSPIDYLKSCLPFSNCLLMIEANRYNPLLYWMCNSLEEERLFLKMNSLRRFHHIIEKGGWRCEKSFYIESAAYPIGFCIYHDVYHGKKMIKTIMKYLAILYDFRAVSSSIDKIENLVEKVCKPFCSEFIIIARKQVRKMR